MLHPYSAGNIFIRKLHRNDAQALYKNAKYRELALYTDLPYPYPLSDIKKFIRKSEREAKAGKTYHFGIELEDERMVIGVVSLTNIDKQNKKAEIEIWIGKKYWRIDAGTVATNLVLQFAFKKLKLNRIYAKTRADNIASQKLLTKTRFKREGCLRKSLKERGRWTNILMYGILREEY